MNRRPVCLRRKGWIVTVTLEHMTYKIVIKVSFLTTFDFGLVVTSWVLTPNRISSYICLQQPLSCKFSVILTSGSQVFTALHGMQTRSSDEICLSVCLSNACIVTKRKINLSNFYTMRNIIQSTFLRRRMVGGGDPFYLKFWVNRPALERNRRFWTNNRS